MAILTRKIDSTVSANAKKYLKRQMQIDSKLYFNHLYIPSDTGNDLHMDAMVELKSDKISIVQIWVMEMDFRAGKLAAKNLQGETGEYARSLAEKYLDSFLQNLEKADLDDITNCEIVLTPELIERIEDEIDNTVDPENLTDADILKYDQVELIVAAEATLRWFFEQLHIAKYYVSFDTVSKTFKFSLISQSHREDREIPLWYVVRRKWERGEFFGKALLGIVADMCKKDEY